jgi:hypothetical protein
MAWDSNHRYESDEADRPLRRQAALARRELRRLAGNPERPETGAAARFDSKPSDSDQSAGMGSRVEEGQPRTGRRYRSTLAFPALESREHQRAILNAEARRLARTLARYGVLTRRRLAELSGARRWQRGRFSRALAVAIQGGLVRDLGRDFYTTVPATSAGARAAPSAGTPATTVSKPSSRRH